MVIIDRAIGTDWRTLLELVGALGIIECRAAAREVCARTKCLACARDDHGADSIIGIGHVERRTHLRHHLRRERVHPYGPVERQREDAIGDISDDRFKHLHTLGHANTSAIFSPLGSGPKRFSPFVPSMHMKTNNTMPPM